MNTGNYAAEQRKTDSAANNLAAFIPLFREISNLKRIRAAGSKDSFAANLFRRSWSAVIGGAPPRTVAAQIARDAVIGAHLGAIDREVLQNAELKDAEINLILGRSFDAAAAAIDSELGAEMRGQIASGEVHALDKIPHFVERLISQPRSGATKVGSPKLIFDAPENHGEHSIIVGVYAILLAPVYHADIETVFFAALAHHFHNAYLPDSGFAGEEHLDEFLPRIFDAFRRKCLAEVPENLHGAIQNSLKIIETADAPEAKAFHAADVIDRVLQMRHHAEANEFTLKYAMEEAELVHAGAIQEFHYEVLNSARLI